MYQNLLFTEQVGFTNVGAALGTEGQGSGCKVQGDPLQHHELQELPGPGSITRPRLPPRREGTPISLKVICKLYLKKLIKKRNKLTQT